MNLNQGGLEKYFEVRSFDCCTDCLRYLAVLQMQDHGQLHYWLSTVVAALVILASLEGNRDVSCQRVIEVLISLFSCALREATIAEAQALGVVVHSQGPLFGGVQRNVKSSSDNVLVCWRSLDNLVFLCISHRFVVSFSLVYNCNV
ncbi:unnamed protein product [Malus baccata var. baccata]